MTVLSTTAFLLLCIILVVFGLSDLESQLTEGKETAPKKNVNKRATQRAAIESWYSSLKPEEDINASFWHDKMKLQAQHAFHHYIGLVSDVMKSKGATVNFLLVGACDGTHDVTIKERFLPNSHWNAGFVEPMEINVNDLTKYLTTENVISRSHIIKAAVNNECVNATIRVKFPKYEAVKGTDAVPHWLRRQIGGIVSATDKVRDPMWKVEDVRCMTGVDVINEWSKATKKANPKKKQKEYKASQKKRVHILKIDAEGFDFEVLASFFPKTYVNSDLPLMINFEAKSMKDKYQLARELLLSRGYEVSVYGTDGFAMLKPQNVFNVKKDGGTAMTGDSKVHVLDAYEEATEKDQI